MAPRHSADSDEEPRRLGRTAVVLGAAGVLLAHVLPWYSRSSGADTAPGGGFAALGRAAARLSDASVAAPYFDWLSWAVLAVAVALGIAATRPTRVTDALRLAGFVTGLFGMVVTYYALAQLIHVSTGAGGGVGTVLGPAGAGVWCTVIGFALVAVGAGLGPAAEPADG